MKLQKVAVLYLGIAGSFLAFFITGSLLGASLTQDVGAIQINWSNQRFRSFGIAQIQDKSSEAIAKAEKEAMDKAQANVKDNLESLYSTLNLNGPRSDFSSLRSSIYLAKTEYYDFNSVKVIVEARMSRLYKGLSFLDPTRRFSEAKNTGVILSVDSGIKPASLYSIYDENNQVIFNSSSVYASSFDTSAMGKWFKGRAGNFGEIEKIVGKSPVTIRIKAQDGKMKVSSGEWAQVILGNEALLAESKIALIFE